jgi:DNA-binding response OmpR family regulator
VLTDDLAEARDVFAAGADHVLPRPFVPGHLSGAVHAALRARDPDTILQMASSIRVGDVLFDAERREVRWDDGFRVRFSAREWELLAVLLGHANRFFTAEDLRDAAWGDASLGTDQVRGYVYRLRRKLEGRPLPVRLLTSRGLGYCLRLEAAPQPSVRT